MEKLFDLNIEKVLEHWGVEHALREIIANALDEQKLTNTEDIVIFKDINNNWHIRDYGRGLQYLHFTQNENQEKLNAENLIGKFGVGLKDALAVFNRHNIDVEINSKFANITIKMSEKKGFNMDTLHAVFKEPKNKNMKGTEFIISGVNTEDIEKSKQMFLIFSGYALLETTKHGEVYQTNGSKSYIYVNGMQVAYEENFMFSYNITNISSQIKKALNRERSNVGRVAYSDSIKKILIQCKNNYILKKLVQDLKNIMIGTNKDESSWLDVSIYAAKTLNNQGNVVFLTSYERMSLTNQQVEILEQSGKEIILITDTLKDKLGSSVTTFSNVMEDYTDSFEYNFVSYKNLTAIEKKIFDTKKNVIDFLKRHRYNYNIEILISETIRINEYGERTDGVFDGNRIIIKRESLTKEKFLGVLIHEFAHYISGAPDNSREFENILTEMLGKAMNDNIDKKSLLDYIFNR